ncbi:MAG: DHHA1 domain-containing protein [Candidatus Binatia bacterium]
MKEERRPKIVHIVSHGPHCLDGVAAAAAIARFYPDAEVRPRFSGNTRINEVLQDLDIEGPVEDQELWITDISWTAPETDEHLRRLAARGLPIYWIDHHRTAIERAKSGRIDVPFAHKIVDDRYAAARLVFEYLRDRLRSEGRDNPALERFGRVIEMADDNDRWLHRVEGSWDLALTLRSMNGAEAFDDLVTIDENVTYTPRMRAAHRKVEEEMNRSFAIAEASRRVVDLPSGVRVVAAVCDGYPSEIADRWGKSSLRNAVFVLFDLKSAAISYRRSPDCEVDLSKVAESFGGGGHPAAAGSEMPELLSGLGAAAAERVAAVVGKLEKKR